MTSAAFTHRTLLGWISEFVNRPLPGDWPQIPLDDETLSDLSAYFDLCKESGYTEVVLWGLFVDRRWPLDIASCVNTERRKRIDRVLEAAHQRGLKVLSGLGLFSWGFDAIIEAHPHLSRTNPRVLCPSVPEAHDWMAKVTEFVLGGFDIDGLNMQSADNGRCECDDCKGLSTVAYHARLNIEVAQSIRARWPGKTLVMDNWGCPFSDPADLPHLAALSREVSYIIDHNNSAEKAGRTYRRQLIAALACPFGTLAGRSVWPPQRWARDRWFLPTTLVNVDYLRALYADGGRATEQFVTTLANPSGEITLRFMGRLLTDVEADAGKLLRDAVEATYEPEDSSTLDVLVEIVRATEAAYFENAGWEAKAHVGLFYVDGGLMPTETPSPETYLRRMSSEGRRAYAGAIERAAHDFERIRARIGRRAQADLTARCFQTVSAEIRRYGSM